MLLYLIFSKILIHNTVIKLAEQVEKYFASHRVAFDILINCFEIVN
jgi:hypothetical protein